MINQAADSGGRCGTTGQGPKGFDGLLSKQGTGNSKGSSSAFNPNASQDGPPDRSDPPLPQGTFKSGPGGAIGFTPRQSGPDANFVQGGKIPTPAGAGTTTGATPTGTSSATGGSVVPGFGPNASPSPAPRLPGGATNQNASQDGPRGQSNAPLPPGTFTTGPGGAIGFTPLQSGPDANFVQGGDIPRPTGAGTPTGAPSPTGASAASACAPSGTSSGAFNPDPSSQVGPPDQSDPPSPPGTFTFAPGPGGVLNVTPQQSGPDANFVQGGDIPRPTGAGTPTGAPSPTGASAASACAPSGTSSGAFNPDPSSQFGPPDQSDPPSPPGTFTTGPGGAIGFTPLQSGPDANFVQGGEIPTPAGAGTPTGAPSPTGASAAVSGEAPQQLGQILTHLQGQLQQILSGFDTAGSGSDGAVAGGSDQCSTSSDAPAAEEHPGDTVEDAGAPSDTSMLVDAPDDGTSNDAADLVGDWNAVTLDGESVADSDIRINFTEDGQVGSFDGINSGGGTYEAGDGDVSFGGIVNTQVGNSDPEVSGRAETFNEIFQGADSFQIGPDGNLTLTDEDTNRTAVFEPA